MSATKNQYRSGRAIASILAGVGWVMLFVGFAIAASSMSPDQIQGLVIGASCSVSGLTLVGFSYLMRAVFDIASKPQTAGGDHG